MIELKRISDEEIAEIPVGRQTEHQKPTVGDMWQGDSELFRVICQAQLEADQETVEAIVQEIEERLFTFDTDGNLILTSAPPRDRIVAWWQALKQKYVRK